MNRTTILENLVRIRGNLAALEQSLKWLPWDSTYELVSLGKLELGDVLNTYLAGTITDIEVRHWAELVEGRDDIAISDEVKQMIFTLAKPEIEEKLSPDLARKWLSEFKD